MEKNSGLEILHKRHGADITIDKFHYLINDKVAKLFPLTQTRMMLYIRQLLSA